MLHHSLIKSSLFLSSGNILLGYGDRLIKNTGNLVKVMPRTFVVFFAGFVGISGFPPFGIFIGELCIIVAAFRAGFHVAITVFILSLCVIFAGFANQIMKISFDECNTEIKIKEKAGMVWPQYLLLLTSLILCFFIPDSLNQTISDAVIAIGGGLR
jgi:hydrogenase-4 component F